MQSRAVLGEAAEDDAGDGRRCFQLIDDGPDRELSGAGGRKAIDAGGDGRKGNRCQAVGLTEFERAAITRRQRLVLACAAAVPDRADGMNDMPRRQTITFGDFGAAGLTAIQGAAFGVQLRSRGAMDRAIDTAPAEQGRIRGVDDGVNA